MKMKSYLKAFDLCDIDEVGGEPLVQRHAYPTLVQIKQHSKEVEKRHKFLFCLQSAIFDSIFARIINFNDPKVVWDTLREEFQGNDRAKSFRF